MQLLVKRVKLYFDGNGDAPINSETTFNILENSEFNKLYGYMNHRNFKHYANLLCGKWNIRARGQWYYVLVEG